MELTNLETKILIELRDTFENRASVYTIDLIGDNPKQLRGALSSLVTKGLISVDSTPEIFWGNGGKRHVEWPVYWDEDVLTSEFLNSLD